MPVLDQGHKRHHANLLVCLYFFDHHKKAGPRELLTLQHGPQNETGGVHLKLANA